MTSDIYLFKEFYEQLLIGEENAQYVNTALAGVRTPANADTWNAAIANLNTNAFGIAFILPLPLQRGDMFLHVGDVSIEVVAATATTYIYRVFLYRSNYNTLTTDLDDETDLTSAQSKTYSNPYNSCEGYTHVNGFILVTSGAGASRNDLQFFLPRVKCYYDT